MADYNTNSRADLFKSGKVDLEDLNVSSSAASNILVADSSNTGIEFTADPTVDSLAFTDSAGTGATVSWNSIDGTLDVAYDGVTLQVGQEQHFYAKATEAIANGDIVMFAGAQGDHLLIAKADMSASDFAPEYVIGVATQAFANNDFGYVTSFGKVRDLNTNSYDAGNILYLDPDTAGGWTTTEPSPPDHIIQVAAVTNSHLTQGTIFVRPTHKVDTDEVQEGSTNLYYTDARVQSVIDSNSTALNDVSDVTASGATTGQVLTAQSDGTFTFEDTSSPTGLSVTSNSTSGYTIASSLAGGLVATSANVTMGTGWAVGDVISITNTNTSADITVTLTGDVYFIGNPTAVGSSITLGARGYMTMLQVASGDWMLSGGGIS